MRSSSTFKASIEWFLILNKWRNLKKSKSKSNKKTIQCDSVFYCSTVGFNHSIHSTDLYNFWNSFYSFNLVWFCYFFLLLFVELCSIRSIQLYFLSFLSVVPFCCCSFHSFVLFVPFNLFSVVWFVLLFFVDLVCVNVLLLNP